MDEVTSYRAILQLNQGEQEHIVAGLAKSRDGFCRHTLSLFGKKGRRYEIQRLWGGQWQSMGITEPDRWKDE